MDTKTKIDILKARLQKLSSSEKDNSGVQRRIRREIRNLEREQRACGQRIS